MDPLAAEQQQVSETVEHKLRRGEHEDVDVAEVVVRDVQQVVLSKSPTDRMRGK